MKKLLFFVLLVTITWINTKGQVPYGFNYQAVARDASGEIIANQQVSILIRILQGTADGETVFEELFVPETNEFGLINLVIGTGSNLYGDFENISWADGPFFFQVQMDPEGGSNYIEMGTTQFLSVPYALHTKTSEDAFSGNYEDLENLPNLDEMIVFEDPQPGDMLFYSANGWESIPLGEEGFVLMIEEGIPQWVDPIDYTVTDIDGNVYTWIEVGGVKWLAQNLRVTHYSNGDPIPLVIESSAWSDLDTGAYCFFNNEPENVEVYGKLYNWFAVEDERGLCPTGWRIPTDDEWKVLEGHIDTQYEVGDPIWDNTGERGFDVGKRLKSTSGWFENGNGIDAIDFTAVPGGYRIWYGGYIGLTSFAYFWSSSEHNTGNAWLRGLRYDEDTSGRGNFPKRAGFSVRCIKD